ncbi:hypothetical protein DOT_1251 [Desulfosporosinus sp. OT]|nr:hypothetical protein DOT_1251 [Desulfosporosinus sp. OT]
MYTGHWLSLGRRTEMMTFEPEDLPVMLISLPWADCSGRR